MTTTTFGDSTRCGDWAAVLLEVDGDRIVRADYDRSKLDRELEGLTLLEAAAVGGDDLWADALARAIGPVFTAPADPTRVAVALSGGVDSAVALLHAGPNPIGVTLNLWLDPYGPDTERACCSVSSVMAARRMCHERGIPHITLDLKEEFYKAVVTPFVRGYERGETPNPCTRCNGGFRFAELVDFAKRAGAVKLLTGHYARLAERDGTLLVHKGLDERKDQSYMLATIQPELLGMLSFPLGEQDKQTTRQNARDAGLGAVAEKLESQEACFLAGDDYRTFLTRRGLTQEPGTFVDEDGRELGAHDGFWRFTEGQRRGVQVNSGGQRLHVLETRPDTNQVVVGPAERLARRTIHVKGRMYLPVAEVMVKLRYQAPAIPARVEPTTTGFILHLTEPAYAVPKGQTAVCYDGDTVVGAGRITLAER